MKLRARSAPRPGSRKATGRPASERPQPGPRPTPPRQIVLAAGATKTYEVTGVELVNVARWVNGNLPPLKREPVYLDVSAEQHCEDMIAEDFFAHQSLDDDALSATLHFYAGEMPWDRMAAVGYANRIAAGENLALGFETAEEVMNAWMNSAGHRGNILSTNYREIGVAYVKGPDDWDHYCSQNFGSRIETYPVVIEREVFETAARTVDLYVYGQGWAEKARFSNDGTTWSNWWTYSSNVRWTLSSGDGLKTVYCEIKDAGGAVLAATDTIYLEEYVISDSGGSGGSGSCALTAGRGSPADALGWGLPYLAIALLCLVGRGQRRGRHPSNL